MCETYYQQRPQKARMHLELVRQGLEGSHLIKEVASEISIRALYNGQFNNTLCRFIKATVMFIKSFWYIILP